LAPYGVWKIEFKWVTEGRKEEKKEGGRKDLPSEDINEKTDGAALEK